MACLFGVEVRTLSGASWRIEGLQPATLVASLLARASRATAVPLSELCLVLGGRVIEPREAIQSLAALRLEEATVLTVVRDASACSWPAAHGAASRASGCSVLPRSNDILASTGFCEPRNRLLGNTFVRGQRD